MALTELQIPTKQELYGVLRSAANKWNNLVHQANDLAEFISFIETSDLDSIGVPSGQVRVDMQNFRTFLNELVSFMSGNQVTPTNAPDEVIDKIRSL